MTIDRAVMAFAGTMVLIGLTLAYLFSAHWLWFDVFVGLNMIQASITGFCPLVYLFKKMGIPVGVAFK